jgi:hypothetical protein
MARSNKKQTRKTSHRSQKRSQKRSQRRSQRKVMRKQKGGRVSMPIEYFGGDYTERG